jgi:ATP-binding cassette, subfamily B, bacterial
MTVDGGTTDGAIPSDKHGSWNALSPYRRLLGYAAPYRSGWLAIAAVTLVSSLSTLLQPWPMKILVDNVVGGQQATGPLAALLSWLPRAESTHGLLAWVVAGGLCLFVIAITAEAVLAFAWIRVGQRMVYDLAQDLMAHLQRRSLLFHYRTPVGDSLSRVTVDSWSIYTLASSLLVTPARATLMLAITAAVMVSLEPSLAAVALSLAPVTAYASYRFGQPIRQIARLRRQVEAQIRSHVQRTLHGIPVVKVYAQEQRERQRFEAFTEEALRVHRRGAVAAGVFDLGGGLVPAFGMAAVLWLGALRVLDGQLTIGGLLVFIAYLTALHGEMRSLLRVYGTVQEAAAGVERVTEVLEADESVREREGAVNLRQLRGRVELERITFGYRPGQPVLREISLTLQPGETLALVGATGAGKTTLVGLVPRFFDPWQGRVLLDGVDVRDVTLKSLREQVALVLQEPFLFPLSIAENIAYGRREATPSEIEAAARAASAHDFIMRLPQGYATVIGERGVTLSGGERQRIAIARALLKDAPVLILDEPTSALDAETEALLLEALQRLMSGRTTLIIAHRFSTIRNAERIAVLEGGSVVECGSHSALMARRGVYWRLHSLQRATASCTRNRTTRR